MITRCTFAFSGKYLPRGLHRQLRSHASCLQVVRSWVDTVSGLQEETHVHYPYLHENPKNNISPIKCITYKVLSLNKVLGFWDILDILNFLGYFVHFLGFRGILVIFWVLGVFL